MKLEYGAPVTDKNDELLGKIDYIVMDTWTGEQRKFMVHRDAPQADIFFTPENVAQTTEGKVRLNLTLSELQGE